MSNTATSDDKRLDIPVNRLFNDIASAGYGGAEIRKSASGGGWDGFLLLPGGGADVGDNAWGATPEIVLYQLANMAKGYPVKEVGDAVEGHNQLQPG